MKCWTSVSIIFVAIDRKKKRKRIKFKTVSGANRNSRSSRLTTKMKPPLEKKKNMLEREIQFPSTQEIKLQKVRKQDISFAATERKEKFLGRRGQIRNLVCVMAANRDCPQPSRRVQFRRIVIAKLVRKKEGNPWTGNKRKETNITKRFAQSTSRRSVCSYSLDPIRRFCI